MGGGRKHFTAGTISINTAVGRSTITLQLKGVTILIRKCIILMT